MKAACYLGRDEEGLPNLGLQIRDEYNTPHATTISPFEARHLGYMLISMASEIESQQSYITALRARKEDELEIMKIMEDAAEWLRHKRETNA
jgi:hypothetical protein